MSLEERVRRQREQQQRNAGFFYCRYQSIKTYLNVCHLQTLYNQSREHMKQNSSAELQGKFLQNIY